MLTTLAHPNCQHNILGRREATPPVNVPWAQEVAQETLSAPLRFLSKKLAKQINTGRFTLEYPFSTPHSMNHIQRLPAHLLRAHRSTANSEPPDVVTHSASMNWIPQFTDSSSSSSSSTSTDTASSTNSNSTTSNASPQIESVGMPTSGGISPATVGDVSEVVPTHCADGTTDAHFSILVPADGTHESSTASHPHRTPFSPFKLHKHTICAGSLNARELQSPRKRQVIQRNAVFHTLCFLLLQETHVAQNSFEMKPQGDQLIFSSSCTIHVIEREHHGASGFQEHGHPSLILSPQYPLD